jgi:hypothetical protein
VPESAIVIAKAKPNVAVDLIMNSSSKALAEPA